MFINSELDASFFNVGDLSATPCIFQVCSKSVVLGKGGLLRNVPIVILIVRVVEFSGFLNHLCAVVSHVFCLGACFVNVLVDNNVC